MAALDDRKCGQHRGAHGPYEFPPFRADDYVRPATKPDVTQEYCDQAHAHAPRPLAVADPKTPLEIIRQLYEDLLSSNGLNGVSSDKNRAKYFAPALLPVFAAGDQDACAAAIEMSGQAFDAAEVKKSLLISPVFDDGRRAVISARVRGTKGAPLDVRNFEFLRDGKQWKISDVVEGKWRFSEDCAEERRKAAQ
ncbi:MAG TPA: hypothetical protein VIJ63_02680 [Roseiarcus sp.]